MKRALALVASALALIIPSAASADDEFRPPVPEGGTVVSQLGGTCTKEGQFDADMNATYGAKCHRLKIVFGPILVKPGQNDILIQPVTFEKPLYDGYMVRFKPSLVDQTGFSPPVEELHLHHGTWLNTPGSRAYGSGPWLATGEEKTVATWPVGYGLEIKASDQWLFLHMVHNALPTSRMAWVNYDVDYVEKAAADAEGLIKNTKGIWLDVNGGPAGHPDTENYPFNPVYNAQRGFGSIDPATGKRVCSFPDQNCANFNSSGNVSAQQGKEVDSAGRDYKIPAGFLGPTGEGVLVVMGGHLHNGGLRDEVSLVRDGVEKLIHVSDAYYFDAADRNKVGAPAISWDFAMSGVSADIGWRIKVKEGDILRLNAIYDTEIASWYENMGIVMTWVAPGETNGYDPFAAGVTYGKGVASTSVQPLGVVPGASDGTCTPTATNYCVRGQLTHGAYDAGRNHGINPNPPALPAGMVEGQLVDNLPIGGFKYGLADLGAIGVSGIPRVKVGTKLTFWNADTADNMWHTVTRCAAPCTGATTVDYPIADGGLGVPGDVMDFDSSELGVGLSIPARTMGLTGVALEWSITPPPGSEGVYTFYCRIHPSMRGAFKVVAA